MGTVNPNLETSKPNSFVVALMGRGLLSDLAQRIEARFGDWEALCAASTALLADHFSPDELDAIRRSKARREIPSETVNRLIDECGFRCCLCWDLDCDSGVIIHHIRAHAAAPDDRYENLIVLCIDHHSKVHTKWELARHPYPPELLIRRKAEFAAAIADFKAGKRVAPGREKNTETGVLVSPPLPPAHFIGRDILMRDIGAALRFQNRRAAIIGMGGVGKTALALKVADACRQEFSGGILWTEVATDFGAVPEILRTWIRSLGHDATGMETDEQLALFTDLLTKRAATSGPLLLLIDDVREIVVKEFVRLTSHVPPEVSILITTREATVGAAVCATQFRVEPLERAHCRQLLETISGSSLLRKEESAADRLLSLLGDLPLAVELVARQIAVRERKPAFSITVLCRRLEEFDSQILSFPGHRGIAMSFALSYENLEEKEQQIFRSFGIFISTSLDTTSVAAVCALGNEDVETTLDRLVVVSMLNWGTGVGDYRIHPLLHKYSEFLFGHSSFDEQKSTRDRFYQHYTSTAIATAKDAPDDLKTIDRILPNLIKAIQCASASGDYSAVTETVLGLCAGMGFFTSRNLERESMSLLEMAATAAKYLGDRNAESAAIGHLGTAYARLGIIKDAVVRFERAIIICRETSNDFDLASHLQNLGGALLSEAKDLPRAERLLHEALNVAKRSQNVEVVIGCFSTLGSLHRGIGNLNEAARLQRIQPCWMDDVFEIAYRELVQQQPVATLPAFPGEFVTRILRLKPDDQELLKWARDRKSDREITAQTRAAAQDQLLPREQRREMVDENEFWELLKDQVQKILSNTERRRELLEVVLGTTFRFRHPDSIAAIDEAFARFTDQTYTKYYVSLAILMTRLAYMYAPLIRFKNDSKASPRKFIGRSIANQRNNPGDEQCIVAAMLCDRLITRDEGMKNVTEMFRLNGFTNCRTFYLDPRVEVVDQILQLKS